MIVLVAFELGYLSPPVALNQLLTRQVVGDAEIQLAGAEVADDPSFWRRYESLLLPITVMATSLVPVAFVPLIFTAFSRACDRSQHPEDDAVCAGVTTVQPRTKIMLTCKTLTSRLGSAAIGAAVLVAGALQPAAAQNETRTLCVYDPIGANGFIYQSFQDYVVQARSWGIKLETRAYTDEAVAANDFKAGKCDMAG